MAKFLTGLIIGIVVGVLAMAANPDLPQDLRVTLANLTAQIMRTAGETAEEVGDAAEELADEATEADIPPATEPGAPARSP
jgi:gas vesicle protein